MPGLTAPANLRRQSCIRRDRICSGRTSSNERFPSHGPEGPGQTQPASPIAAGRIAPCSGIVIQKPGNEPVGFFDGFGQFNDTAV